MSEPNQPTPDRSHWPKHVRAGLTFGEEAKIGIDPEGHLYWDGKKIKVARRLDLSKAEKIFALVVGFFTVLGSIGAVAQGWAAAHQWSCQAAYITTGCPSKADQAGISPVDPRR